jgi:hypothetical protein
VATTLSYISIVRSKWNHIMPIVRTFVVLYVDEYK